MNNIFSTIWNWFTGSSSDDVVNTAIDSMFESSSETELRDAEAAECDNEDDGLLRSTLEVSPNVFVQIPTIEEIQAMNKSELKEFASSIDLQFKSKDVKAHILKSVIDKVQSL